MRQKIYVSFYLLWIILASARSHMTSQGTSEKSNYSQMNKGNYLSPVLSVRNFDLSYINNRMGVKWPGDYNNQDKTTEDDIMTNSQLK